jgi:hypothetical protein
MGQIVIEGLGLTEAGLRRIIAMNVPGWLTLRDWDDNLDGYAQYVAREGQLCPAFTPYTARTTETSSIVISRPG